MCIFLILILPDEKARTIARPLAEPFGARLGNATIPSLMRQLPAKAAPAFATRGHCDCGTRLGCKSHDDPEDFYDPQERYEESLERRRAKVRKAGWSAAKIERWEAQQRQSRDHHARARASRKEDTLTLDEWRQMLTVLLASPHIPHLDLLIHMFSGGRDDEKIALKGQVKHRLPQLDDEALMDMKWDMVHTIGR